MKNEIEKENSMRQLNEWLRRIQQNMKSIEKRIDAIERRLSGEPFKNPDILEDDFVNEVKRKMDFIEEKLKEMEEKQIPTISIKRDKNQEKELIELRKRIENIEKRKIRVGGFEIPFEITGIIGGGIIIIISILLFLGYRHVVSSPLFVASVGIILLLSAISKVYMKG